MLQTFYASTFQRQKASTLQCINALIFNETTFQPFNPSPLQTPQPFKPSTNQLFDASTLKSFNASTYQSITVPSNAHISTPFFQKTVFFSKIFFGKPPSKLLEVCLNSEYM
jgi:hypothetical protein